MAERSDSKLDHHVPFDDLRQWMEEADKLGELRKVDGASWEEDIGLGFMTRGAQVGQIAVMCFGLSFKSR